jgi:serine/threonine protein kinase
MPHYLVVVVPSQLPMTAPGSPQPDSQEFAAAAAALAPDFVLQREIGRGGMGVVFVALDVRLDRLVAIKVLPAAFATSSEIRDRFLREARTAAKLMHPSVVPVFRADEMGGVVFFVMAYVDGESLADRLRARGALPALEAIGILRDVALALDYAHERGIVHRDIKPENILLERGTGHALVTDFGIARIAEAKPLTATGQVLGTVHYMSPEQVSGEELDGRSDLYSLAVVGFRMLAGRLPFEGEMASAVLVAHVVKAPPSLADVAPHVPRALAGVIEHCLAKQPSARFASCRAFVSALDEAAVAIARTGETHDGDPAIVSEREAQALWARASELQAQTGVQTMASSDDLSAARAALANAPGSDRRSRTSGYKMNDVRAAAEEAGIAPRYIARAASELGLSAPAAKPMPPTMVAARPAPDVPFIGGPSSISVEVVVPGEIPEADYYLLAEIIRRRIRQTGAVNTLGRSLTWTCTAQGHQIEISVVPRAGRTTIRADERLGPLIGGTFGGIMGGLGGGLAGPSFGIGAGAMHSVALGFGFWGVAIAGSYLLARTVFRRVRQTRERVLREVVQELAEQASDSIRGQPAR